MEDKKDYSTEEKMQFWANLIILIGFIILASIFIDIMWRTG
jgi:hypothetical protein